MDGAELRRLRTRFDLTQTEVAHEAGLQQPVLSAIEHDRRGSPETRARVVAAIRRLVRPDEALDDITRAAVRAAVEERGGRDIRVFGSVARGDDRPGSDLDIIARFDDDFDLLDLMELESTIEQITGLAVDVVSDDPRMPYALTAAKAEAIPL